MGIYNATINLRRAWFTDALTPNINPIVCGTRRATDRLDSQDGQVRQYAGGRVQGVSTPAALTTLPITLVGLSYAQWQVLLAWKKNGTTILFRSSQGERFYATFFEVSTHAMLRTTMNDGRAFDATVTLYEVDYDEFI